VFDVAALDYVFPALPSTCAIGAAGGTLGRDERNTLVLPDRYQRVSRLHAEITFVRGVPILSNKSGTLVVNVGDQEVRPGESAIVQDDYVIEIGPYLLSARVRDAQRVAPMQPTASTATAAREVNADTLMQAFAHGAGMADDAFKSGRTVANAELIGGMVRHAVQGAMDLLAAGAITQREIRVNTALVAEQSNNPLRFWPMPHAFADLLAHDAGVMADMHAALADMLVRLDPRASDASVSSAPDVAVIIAPQCRQSSLVGHAKRPLRARGGSRRR